MDMAKNIKYYRERARMYQSELGRILNVSPQAVSKWETGQSEPDSKNILKMCRLFDVTADELLGSGETVASATISEGIILDDEEMILVTNYRKLLPEYQAIIQQIAGSSENQRKEASSSAG